MMDTAREAFCKDAETFASTVAKESEDGWQRTVADAQSHDYQPEPQSIVTNVHILLDRRRRKKRPQGSCGPAEAISCTGLWKRIYTGIFIAIH